MKIVQPSVTLVHHTPDLERVIERMGRICYQSSHKVKKCGACGGFGGEVKTMDIDGVNSLVRERCSVCNGSGTDVESAREFIRMILKRGHESVIEHASAGFLIITDRGCCYDAATEVLTRAGWKFWQDVRAEDQFACLDDNEVLQWHRPKTLYGFDYDGELLAFESSMIDLLVTPNHNMWVFDHDKRAPESRRWKFLRAVGLTNGRYRFTQTARWNGRPHHYISIPEHPTKFRAFPEVNYAGHQVDNFFELLGLWATDGSYQNGTSNGSCALITQTKSHGRVRIGKLCHELGLRCSWHDTEARIDNLRFHRYLCGLFGSGPKSLTVRVPQIVKEASAEQIKRFLDGVVAGNGTVHKKNGHIVIYTASKGFADDLQELWMKVGLSAAIRTVLPRDRGSIAGVSVHCTATTYVVSVHGTKRSKPLLVRKCAKRFGQVVSYKGKVYCAEVPGHRLYVRRNGKPVWCGNSHEIVRHRLASYSQESTRYCNYNKEQFGGEITVIQPPGLDSCNQARYVWEESVKAAELSYNGMVVGKGIKPEIARSVLPNSLKSEIGMTANFREWRHFLRLRTSPKAHPQMREIAEMIRAELLRISKVCFEDIP